MSHATRRSGVLLDLTGQRFGMLVVLRRGANSPAGAVCWLCQCDCGRQSSPRSSALVRANGTKSCGCMSVKWRAAKIRRHGRAGTPIYDAWAGMIARCNRPTWRGFSRYGGRGIKVCDRWMDSFENFLTDMGERPSPHHSLDRINNDGNYEPGNCRWATDAVQSMNKCINVNLTAFGETKCMTAWSRDPRCTVHADTIRWRVVRNAWPVESAIVTPPHQSRVTA